MTLFEYDEVQALLFCHLEKVKLNNSQLRQALNSKQFDVYKKAVLACKSVLSRQYACMPESNKSLTEEEYESIQQALSSHLDRIKSTQKMKSDISVAYEQAVSDCKNIVFKKFGNKLVVCDFRSKLNGWEKDCTHCKLFDFDNRMCGSSKVKGRFVCEILK